MQLVKNKGRTALILSAINHNRQMVQNLLTASVNVSHEDDYGKTALDYIDRKIDNSIYIALKLHTTLAKAPKYKGKLSLLLDANIQLEAKNSSGLTPLFIIGNQC